VGVDAEVVGVDDLSGADCQDGSEHGEDLHDDERERGRCFCR
jgi:hypothetical protein